MQNNIFVISRNIVINRRVKLVISRLWTGHRDYFIHDKKTSVKHVFHYEANSLKKRKKCYGKRD